MEQETGDKLSYVLFWISMAQAQRMIDESNVQIPNVRACSPFTKEIKNQGQDLAVCLSCGHRESDPELIKKKNSPFSFITSLTHFC